MFNRLLVTIMVPIVALMLAMGALLHFLVLRTVTDFARQNIEEDLDNLTHDLFNTVDHEFMESIKTAKIDDPVAERISQVDCLDALERNMYSRHFELIIYEKRSGAIRLASVLPDESGAGEIVQRFQPGKGDPFLQLAGEEYHVRQFYFPPWDWTVMILKNKKTYAGLSRQVHRVYRVSAIVLLSATVLLAFYLLRSIKQPLSSIISSVSRGNPPDYKGTFEFEFLSQAVSEMMTSLKNEIAEREYAEKKAEAANQAKSEFLANMSHELRTPLNAILGFAQIMERNPDLSSERESLQIIQRSGNHLLTLINQILDLSKIEAGRAALVTYSFDLFHLLDELKNMLSLRAADKKLTLTFERGRNVPRCICTDEIKLRQVLINLLGNAIKFTEEGSVVMRISVVEQKATGLTLKNANFQPPSTPRHDCFLHFEIQDTGVGIAQQEISNLFEIFGQTASGRIVGGTGLGLAISNRFVELLGGNMHLASKVGQGSTFGFIIPVQMVEKNEICVSQTGKRVIGPEPGQPCYRMLIVDDRPDNRKLLARILEPLDFELREAANGKDALDILNAWIPHLIWMDVRMPEMDGYEATRRIRAMLPSSMQPVIIAVTASVFEDKQGAVLECGCDDIIIKPFQEKDIFAILGKYLKVNFVYAEDATPHGQPSVNPDLPELEPSDLDELSREIIEQLHTSVAALEMDAALDTVKEIRKQNESLADALRKLVTAYRFDILQKLLAQGEKLEEQP